jgi:hypothetical protein
MLNFTYRKRFPYSGIYTKYFRVNRITGFMLGQLKFRTRPAAFIMFPVSKQGSHCAHSRAPSIGNLPSRHAGSDSATRRSCWRGKVHVTATDRDTRSAFPPELAALSDTTRHGTTRHDMAQHGTTRHDTTRHDTAGHGTTRHYTTRHDTTRHDTTRRHLFRLRQRGLHMTERLLQTETQRPKLPSSSGISIRTV